MVACVLNRPLLVGALGAVIVGAAIVSTRYIEFEPEAPPKPSVAESARGVLVPPPKSFAKAVTEPEANAPKAAPETAKEPVRPSFDVVRVNPEGDAVIAGRAAPNAEVTVTDGKTEIGKVKADKRGEWVLIPSKSLPSGPHELTLEAKDKKGKPKLLSKRKVILIVPERGKDIAGRKTTKPSGPLVMVVPRDERGATVVMQRPGTPLKPRASAPVTAPEPRDQAEALNRVTPAAGGPATGASDPSGQPAQRELLTIPQRPGGPVQLAAKGADEAPLASELSLDAIDYDDTGNLSMSGQAPEGTQVRIYLDNRPIGGATTGEAGVWRLAPSISVPPGLYKMRVDQVDRTGRVVARVETPFSRAGPMGDLPRGAVVFVQPGNSLWRIARRSYGHGVRYTVIYDANLDQIRNPDMIYPGQIFIVPKVN